MRFLHTSDWHIGKTLRNQRRDHEYQAALAQVLDIARTERVDCLLVAGDIFDSAVPPPEAERIVFDFFREMASARIPAVVIGGNHDHPRRLNAFARILDLVDIYVLGDSVRPEEGGVIEIPTRDKDEVAIIAALPWVSERKAREWDSLVEGGEKPFQDYAEEVARRMADLASGFRDDAINILLAHVMLDGAIVGGEASGERPLHVGQTYAVKPQRLPTNAHYIALGHLHRAQPILEWPPAYYSGSLLQLDFGEVGQKKSVRIVEAASGQSATVQEIELTGGRSLRDLGSPKAGLTLDQLRPFADNPDYRNAYLRLFLQVDRPFPGLAERVRELLPNVVDIIPLYPQTAVLEPKGDFVNMSPTELFLDYYRQGHAGEPPQPVLDLFHRLYEEVVHDDENLEPRTQNPEGESGSRFLVLGSKEAEAG